MFIHTSKPRRNCSHATSNAKKESRCQSSRFQKNFDCNSRKSKAGRVGKEEEETNKHKIQACFDEKSEKVKDSRPKSKNNPWQTKSYTGTKRRLNLRDDKSSSEDEALVLSMRHNFETNTSDDNCEEFDTDLPLQPQGEVWKCCFCGENYEDSRSGEQWVRCTCSNAAHGRPLLKNSKMHRAGQRCFELLALIGSPQLL